MKITIVIPVYNEADQLHACLAAIARQEFPPSEVLVVDNNSTDSSVRIASQYSFVTIISQKRQGVVHARNLAFDQAKGEVIGRIDADTILPNNWTRTIADIFDNSDVDAVSGSVLYYDLPSKKFFSKLDLYFRARIANSMKDEVFLFGSNMAIRKSTWLKARSLVCNSAGVHEDFDLAIHAYETGAHVAFNKTLIAEVSLRRFNTNFKDYWRYVWLSPHTYTLHGRKSQRHMYPVVWLVIMFYWAIKIAYRSYDPQTDKVSLRNLIASSLPIRVNPATFVD
jgi:glycosyltransferase involved in cell wall biosynthesis